MAMAFGPTLLLLLAVVASAQDDSTALFQRLEAVHPKTEQPLVAVGQQLGPGSPPQQRIQQAPRRIQYLFDAAAGLTDRIHSFTFVNNLAHLHNATAHIPGGRFGARKQLTSKHSMVIADDWGVYFDLTAHNGNPFHTADPNMTGCRTFEKAAPWTRLFNNGETCVNIKLNLHAKGLPPELFDHQYSPRPSARADSLAAQALVQAFARPFDFGFLHIRRCDRLKTNAECTDPENITALLAPSIESTWLIFTYAELGYLPSLKKHLKALEPHKRFVYEDDLHFDAGDDNYLLYVSSLAVRGMASNQINLHHCIPGQGARQPPEQELVTLPPLDEEILSLGTQTGICFGDDARGPYSSTVELAL